MKPLPMIISIIVLGTTLLLNALVPVPEDRGPMGERIGRRIPTVMGEWSLLRDLPVAEEEFRILGTDDIIHRVYEDTGGQEDVYLSLVFSSGHRHSMHPPEVCYQAGGYTMVSRGQVDLEYGVSATVLRIVRGEDNQLVNYWFFSEGRETANYIVHQIHLVLNQILIRSQPSVLVRLSTRIQNADVDSAQQRLVRFAHASIPVLRERLSMDLQEQAPEVGGAQN